MHRPTVMLAFAFGVVLCVFAACKGGGSDSLPTAPSVPTPPVVPTTPTVWWDEASDWIGTATLVSCSGFVCGQIGHTASDQTWRIVRSGSDTRIGLSYNFDEDFNGTIDGRRFVATYSFFTDQATLEGEFADDGNSFEAVETFDHALADYQGVVHHRAIRIQ